MIFVIVGTEDGRMLAKMLADRGHIVLASAVTTYGVSLIQNMGIEVVQGPLGYEDMVRIMKDRNIVCVVDASHPHARVVSETAHLASMTCSIPYIRYERYSTPLPSYERIHLVKDMEDLMQTLGAYVKEHTKFVIFSTLGSKTLPYFHGVASQWENPIYYRVLPTTQVLEVCEEVGISPKYILAMQGPFSKAMNEAIYKEIGADVVLMKESGEIGGSDTKIEAAMDLGLTLFVIERPKTICIEHIYHTFEEVIREIEAHDGICKETKRN